MNENKSDALVIQDLAKSLIKKDTKIYLILLYHAVKTFVLMQIHFKC